MPQIQYVRQPFSEERVPIISVNEFILLCFILCLMLSLRIVLCFSCIIIFFLIITFYYIIYHPCSHSRPLPVCNHFDHLVSVETSKFLFAGTRTLWTVCQQNFDLKFDLDVSMESGISQFQKKLDLVQKLRFCALVSILPVSSAEDPVLS